MDSLIQALTKYSRVVSILSFASFYAYFHKKFVSTVRSLLWAIIEVLILKFFCIGLFVLDTVKRNSSVLSLSISSHQKFLETRNGGSFWFRTCQFFKKNFGQLSGVMEAYYKRYLDLYYNHFQRSIIKSINNPFIFKEMQFHVSGVVF